MRRLFVLSLLLLAIRCIDQSGEAIASPSADGRFADSLILAQPINCGQLTIYLVEGPSSGPHYLTLQNALRTGRAIIHENNSQALWIENRSDTDLYLQAGDIIKGGQQDRMIAADMIVTARDTIDDLQVYCVEHGRSTQRGTEPVATFSSSTESVPLSHMILTANHELTSQLLTPKVGGLTEPDPAQLALVQSLGEMPQTSMVEDAVQDAIWSDVSQIQSRLTAAAGDSLTKNQSPTSLELTLEHPWVHALMGECSSLTRSVERNTDVVGAIFCLNGQIVGGHLYSSHDLFRDMWIKNYQAASVATIAMGTDHSTTLNGDSLQVNLDEVLRMTDHPHPVGKEASRTLDNGRISDMLLQITNGVILESRDTKFSKRLLHRTFLPDSATK